MPAVDDSFGQFLRYTLPSAARMPIVQRRVGRRSRFMDHQGPPLYQRQLPNTSRCRQHRRGLGSSLGGLISAYQASQWSNVFGKIGCSLFFLPSVHALPYTPHSSQQPVRVYPSVRHLQRWISRHHEIQRFLVRVGYVFNMDLDNAIGFGDSHNEDAWKHRVHERFNFCFQPATNRTPCSRLRP